MLRLIQILAGVVFIASFGIWVYAYGFVERSKPDQWADPTVGERAEAICADAVADLDDLPGALEADDGADRADQIRLRTDRLSTMIDQLDDLAPTEPNDAHMHSGWVADWRTLAADRYAYAEAIGADPSAQLLLTDVGVERLDKRLTRFANDNEMFSCVAPTDV